MINIIENPFDCSLSKNPINFKLFAPNFSAEHAVYPSLKLSFQYRIEHGKFISFSFINPLNGNSEKIVFIAKNGALLNGTDIPGSDFHNTNVNANFIELMAEHFRANTVLSTFYNIEASGTDLKIVAREGVEELIITGLYNNYDVSGFPPYSSTFQNKFWKPTKRPGHRVKFNVYFEHDYMSNVFELVSKQHDTVDNDGYVNIEIASVIDSEIKSSFTNSPLPDLIQPTDADLTQKGKVLRRYYIEVCEVWQDMTSPVEWVKSKVLHSHFGGVSMDDFSRNNIFNYLREETQCLTWWRDKKRLYREQQDWLSFCNYFAVDGFAISVKLKLLYKDATDETFLIGQQTLNKWETITVQVGFLQLNIPAKQNASKEVYGWQILFEKSKGGDIAKRTYLYQDISNFKTNTIVYLNSYGVAESFVCTGFFDRQLQTSSEIASKTLMHDYKSINGRDFVFNKTSKNTYKARSGILNKSEAKALKSMLNVAPVFLFEDELMRPIIIDTGTFSFDEENEITQRLEFNITKSLELTNVSEMVTKPVLKITENCGVFRGEVHSEVSISTHDDMIVSNYEIGTFETVSWNNGYQGAITAQVEGFYIFSTTVTIGLSDYKLEETYHFQRESAWFDSPNHNSYPNYSMMELKTSISENFYLSAQSDSDFTATASANVMLSIGGVVNKGVKTHRLSSACLANVYRVKWANQDYTNFKLEQFTNLKQIDIFSCKIQEHFSTANWKDLELIYIKNSGLKSFELGMNLNLRTLDLEDNDLSTDAIHNLIIEIYRFRKMFFDNGYQFVFVYLSGNDTLNSDSIARINGTGTYSNDGLVDYDIIVNY